MTTPDKLAQEAARLLARIREDTARADALLVQLRDGGSSRFRVRDGSQFAVRPWALWGGQIRVFLWGVEKWWPGAVAGQAMRIGWSLGEDYLVRGVRAPRPEPSVADLGVDAAEQFGQGIPGAVFSEVHFCLRETREGLIREKAGRGRHTFLAPREGVQSLHKCVVVRSSAVRSVGHEPGL
ncbi:hypothetical protein ACFC5Z_41885 [Streptomyces sp. NPDC056004]|uniref:hypothetical protein n=1 Tax=Streptomyces sp. NPDC056004 TaxID=3345677 RepID=UPI0035E2E18B